MIPPAPKRVLITADTVGGVWTFATELCAQLASQGVDILLFSTGRLPSDAQRAKADLIPNLRLVSTAHRLEWMQDCQADVVESGRVLLQLAREFRPDVVHVNGYYHGTLPFDAPVLLTAHSCVASWWRACRQDAIPLEWYRYLNWVSAAVRQCALLTAPTTAFLESFQAMHGSARSARTIWNGVDPARFRLGPKRKKILAANRRPKRWEKAAVAE